MKSDIGGMKTDIGGMKTDIGGMKTDIAGIKGDIGGINSRVDGINAEIGGLKADVGGIKADLLDIKSDVTVIKSDIGDMKSDIGGLKYEVVAGFKRVDDELDAARIRDEEMRGLIKLNFEALQGHRQSTDAKFETVTTEIREQSDLLNSVLVHVRRRVERVEARKPRRRS